MYDCSEGSGESAHLCSLAWSLLLSNAIITIISCAAYRVMIDKSNQRVSDHLFTNEIIKLPKYVCE